MGSPGFGANTAFRWVGNAGCFLEVGVGSAGTWSWSRIKTKSEWSYTYTSSCVTHAQFCWKSRYDGRGELQKGRLFLEQVLRYLFSSLLWAVGFYRLLLLPVTLRAVVTFRKADWNWNFKDMMCFSDTEIYHKPLSTALVTSEIAMRSQVRSN
jgi:hypothetical protein